MKLNYFEIFGKPIDEVNCFVYIKENGYEFGFKYSLFHQVIEYLEYTVVKIVPRMLVAAMAVLLLSQFLNDDGQVAAFLIIVSCIFYYFPPAIEAIYLIEFSEKNSGSFAKLLFASKERSICICTYKKSFLLKNKSKFTLRKTFDTLLKYINDEHYETTYQKMSKKEFQEHYKLLKRILKF